VVRERRDMRPVELGPQHELARYMTSLTCAECHGPKLEGVKGDTPDVVTAAAYSRAEFEKLITQGVASGGRKLHPLMASVAKNRFSNMTAHERDALYAYLKARAEQPQ
jgi:cytochrome c553